MTEPVVIPAIGGAFDLVVTPNPTLAICESCGQPLPRGTVKWCSNRCRQRGKAVECSECHEKTAWEYPHKPREGAPMCRRCSARMNRTQWTRDAVADALARFIAEKGRPATKEDLSVALGGEYPSLAAVKRAWGTLSAANLAARSPKK